MVPGNVAGLLVFLAALTPGYAWVRVAERYRPRPARSSLFEAVELATAGAFATTLAAALASAVAPHWPGMFIDIEKWAHAGNSYLQGEPYRAMRTLVFVIVAACLLALACALLINRNGPSQIIPGATVWQSVLEYKGSRVFVAVHLKDDRQIEGYVWSFPTAETGMQEIALQAPIFATFQGQASPRKRR